MTLISGTLGIPYVNGVPFLTGADASASERTLLALMNAPSCTEAKVPCYA